MCRSMVHTVSALMLALAFGSCRATDIAAIVPNDSTVATRDRSAPVQTDALAYVWSRNGISWSTTIPIVYRNITLDTVSVCTTPAYPVGLEKRINGQWVPFASRPTLDGGCQKWRAIAPGAKFADTIGISNIEFGHNTTGPAFAGPDIDGVYRMVLGGFRLGVAQGQPAPGDSLFKSERVSNPFVVRRDTLL